MANDTMTMQDFAELYQDKEAFEVFLNADENTDVTTRLGKVYPSLKKAIKIIMQNGMVGSTPYRTYADLLKSTLANNSYGIVTNDNDLSKNGLWQKIDNVWVYSQLNTVPQIMSEINKAISFDQDFYDSQGRKVAWGVVDDSDKLGAWVADDGTINASNIYSDDNSEIAFAIVDDNDKTALSIDKNGNATMSGVEISDGGIYPLSFVDYNNRLLLAIDNNGDIVNMGYESFKQSVKNFINSFNKKDQSITPQKTDYMHVISYGQSLSRGSQAFNPINVTQPYQNVMFKSGVLTRDWENADYTAFVPLIEQDNGKGEAESPVSGILNTFVTKQIAKGDTAGIWKMLGSAPGEGGRSVAYLSKGGGRYTDLIKQVSGAMTTANRQNQSYSVWAVTWTQAEQDYEEKTTRLAFQQALLKLHDNLKSDITAITKQSFAPPLICYQVASHRYYKLLRNDLALALLDASLERNDIMIACPMYQFVYAPDSVHIVAESSQMLGRYYANALDYVKTTGKKWQPLQVKNMIVQGRIIDLEFNKSGLVLDTALVTQTANYGFDIWQGDVLQIIIASVAIIDKSRVRIVLSADLPSEAYLSYARGRDGDPYKSGCVEGARGNLRDSNGDIDNYVDRVGKKYMHNWCVAFESKLN